MNYEVENEINPIPVYEVMTFLNQRSVTGRVVINPPEKMAKLEMHKTGEAWYFCYTCGRATLDQQKYLNHVKEHYKSDRIENQIEVTNVLNSDPPVRRSATPINRCDKDVTCSLGDSEVAQEVASRTKMERHKGFICFVCKAAFRKHVEMRIHYKEFHSENQLCATCTGCDEVYPKHYIAKHIKHLHNPENSYTCKYCDVRVVNRNIWGKHMTICHRRQSGRSAPKDKNNSTLKDTSSLESVEEPSNIPKSTAKKKSRTRTNSSQIKAANKTGKKRCSVLKSDKGSLSNNSEGEYYRCKRCPRTFQTLKSLKYHTFAHTGARPFACTLCPMTFRNSSYVYRHQNVCHTSGMFKCPRCPCKFFSKTAQCRHVSMFHGKQQSS